ncbi:PspA/IM30 family protein [Anatilimnocola floriformis]|uniref:PspA/IM30 family protein n=1 Tax=Anatilimnocola floriformis TaxID=2948575 RepID=UPI0020C5640D|nr:PspA/IM30 family protein [Anatilimnocola floriformis]
MGLFRRLTDILSANVNELLEQYEDPELLLKQAIREMEAAVGTARENAVKVVAEEKLLARQLSAEEAAVALWRERATTAVKRGDDEVARSALVRKREHEAVSTALAKQLEEAATLGQTLRRQIESLRLRTEDARRKLVLLTARQQAAVARQRLLVEFSAAPIGEHAFQKFERLCRKVERTEAETEALAELSGDLASHDFTAEQDAREEIEGELSVLKAQLNA